MSMKNTLAHGPNFHFYSDFGWVGYLCLRAGQGNTVTVALTKDEWKQIFEALKRIDADNWKLVTDEDGNTPEAVDEQIKWLEELTKKIRERKKIPYTADQLAELEGDATPFACHPRHLKQQAEEWLPEDELEESKD